jgi:hypothetical protein
MPDRPGKGAHIPAKLPKSDSKAIWRKKVDSDTQGTVIVSTVRDAGTTIRLVEQHHTQEGFALNVRAAAEASLEGRPAPDSWWTGETSLIAPARGG